MNARQKIFADEYIANGFKAPSAYKVAYVGSADSTANHTSYQLLKQPEIKEYIEQRRREIFEAQNVDAMRWVSEVCEIAFAQKGDEVYNTSEKVKALAMIQKYLGLDKQVVEQKTEETITISLED